MESQGIIMFNRGNGIVVRAMVALYTLRKHWDGPVTFYVEKPYPEEFDEVLDHFRCNIVHNEERHDFKTLVRKTSLFENPPYDRTLWIDADVVVNGSLSGMFDGLDDADFCIPHFAGWQSDGGAISKRIKRFKGIAEDRHLEEALSHHPAVNTGVLSFRKSEKWTEFVRYWVDLADKGSKSKIFIPDEVACQILYPSAQEWGIKVRIMPTDYNVSVLHDHGKSQEPKIFHFHGDKHCLEVPSCDIWKKHFKYMCDNNEANINDFLKYADKRLTKYLKGEVVWEDRKNKNNGEDGEDREDVDDIEKGEDVTIVTACDEYYVDILRETFANWRKYKNIDKYPVIVFVHGIPIEDSRLDFLKLPNVTIIPWKMDNADSHREEMLSAFVFGTAENVKTDYWLKLDADSYATDYRPFINEDMKKYAFCGHKWGYSRPEHIRKFDEWAKGHWKRKLRLAPPMISEGREEGNRFYHKGRRTISFIQLHKTKFTRFCVKLLKERKLPSPTQDTYMYYVAYRFDPTSIGVKNFKKEFGFTQGRGKMGADYFKVRMKEIDDINEGKSPTNVVAKDAEGDTEDFYSGDMAENNVEAKISSYKPSVFFRPVAFKDPELLSEKDWWYNVLKNQNKECVKIVEKFPPISKIPEGEGWVVEIREKNGN